MAIRGLGVDIVEIERIRDLITRAPRAAQRLFTQRELDYCMQRASCYSHLAGRFAAKEAVAKALGSSLSWQDVEVINDDSGKPTALLRGPADELARKAVTHISISHSRDYAAAVAVVED